MGTLLLATGRAITTNRIKGSGTEPNQLAWGSGAGVTADADTTLFTEESEARVAGASSQATITTANDTYQVVGTLTANANKTITNAGLFDAAAAGNAFMKADFAGMPLTAGDSIQFTMQVQFT